MGRPKKTIEGETVETEEAAVIETNPNKKAPYIKNGVTILRYPADEKALVADGWMRKA